MAGSDEELDWDADDFDPEAGFAGKTENPEWEGEDEGINPDELKIEEAPPPSSDNAPKKPPKKERIEEKKAKRRAEELVKLAAVEEQTVEDKFAEKLRLERIQKESDLEVAKSLFGVSNSGSIDGMHPTTPQQFDELKDALRDKLLPLEVSPHYIGFLDDLLRTVCVGLDVEDLRRLSSTLNHLANEKQKAAKAAKSKKKAKASLGTAGKAAKKADQTRFDDYNDELGAEYDDFM